MKDDINNIYIPLIPGLISVFKEVDRTKHDPNTVYKIDEFVSTIVPVLARRNPSWEFISPKNEYASTASDGTKVVRRFNVYGDGELLGTVWKESNGYCPVYAYDNERLKAKRQRGYYKSTQDKTKAVREIERSFYSKTDDELLVKAREQAFTMAYGVAAQRSGAWMRERMRLEEAALDYVLENWGSLGPLVVKDDPERVAKVPQIREAAHEGEEFKAEAVNGRVTTVLIRRDRYLTVRKGASEDIKKEYTSDTLPSELRLAIGFLKLQDPGGFIPGVGVRASADTFLVLDKENEGG